MNILLTIGIVIVGIIVLLLIIALFVKKDCTIIREISINKPKQEVFNYIKYVKNQDNYSKWNMQDPQMKKEYVGNDGAVGFIYKWDSNDKHVGKGEQTINAITEGQKIDMGLLFIKPFAGIADASMTTENVSGNQTRVKWSFTSHMKYPMNLMSLFMNMEKMMGNDLQAGLSRLKDLLEKR
ncbi:MAG TPA: SRPBCC family protein [Chitinophagaceae bacterium]|nr:SRPBCC family protein [Chitinophagaceae bacterium]